MFWQLYNTHKYSENVYLNLKVIITPAVDAVLDCVYNFTASAFLQMHSVNIVTALLWSWRTKHWQHPRYIVKLSANSISNVVNVP